MPGAKQDGEPLPQTCGGGDQGLPFCEACACEQEVYFAIGELTHEEETHVVRGGALAEALKMMRRERAGSTEGIAAKPYHGLSGAPESLSA